ncbi:DUF4011 domain-containing protein [Microbacterium caowuchunii]|uniref:DUF4011 domain-containing protein n=1 Tax=Microbacterium caowuchunii TaxID=2614638 RepID=UPI0012463F7D|nr:DUF4011 domain-containing protein [Microbacterium caowuchunii]QEW00351.1 DUF4011 domain-containing protein [Microbacterium caowuchunii]
MADTVKEDERLATAVKAWRESLILLSGRNRLLNYRPTRSSTLEFTRATADEVIAVVEKGKGVPVVGLVPPADPAAAKGAAGEEDLEAQALDVIEDFAYDAFPDHLFVNKTQRDVDRALKTLAATASREFLDRGLSVLYLALGSLHWNEANGDARVSPLVFFPVELRAAGPKQPQRVYPSEEDLVVNPALEIRLREEGVTLPDQTAIEQLIAEGGMAAVERVVSALPMPKGWKVEPLCVLSAFMFAKEAMFRDLEANEERVLASPLVQALGGSTDAARERLVFAPAEPDDIDTIAPPEQVPLILDADSTQRVAVAAAAEGKSFVLDGPPGTGKSQTIANIIATLAGAGKKVLFVSEKAVALDVVRDRLSSRGLGPILFELHSHKATRAEVAKSLGQALREKPSIVTASASQGTARAKELRETLTGYAAAMNERREPAEWTIHEVLGMLAGLPAVDALPRAGTDGGPLDPLKWDEIVDLSAAVSAAWPHLVQGDKHLWRGINVLADLEYDVASARTALQELVTAMDTVAPARADLGLDGTDTWSKLDAVAKHWHSGQQEWRDEAWVATAPADSIAKLTDLLRDSEAVLGAHARLTSQLGPQWRTQVGLERPKPLSSQTRAVFPVDENAPLSVTKERSAAVARWSAEITALQQTANEVAGDLGLHEPRFLGDIDTLRDLADVIAREPALQSAWLTKHGLDELASALDALAAAQDKERAAAQTAAEVFHPSIRKVDIDPIEERWEGRSALQKVFGLAGPDSKLIAPHARVKPRVAFRSIATASDWQHAREQIEAESATVERLLGYVPVDDVAWASARDILARCRTVLDRRGDVGTAKLAALQASEFGWQATRRSIRDLTDKLEHFKVLSTRLATPFDDPSRLISELTSDAERATAEIDALLTTTDHFAAGGTRSLADVARLQNDADDSDAMWRRFDARLADLALTFPGLGATLSEDWKATIHERLEWTAALHKLTSGIDRRGFLALDATVSSDALERAGLRWDAAREKFGRHFTGNPYASELNDPDDAESLLADLAADIDGAHALSDARSHEARLRDLGLADALDALLRSDIDAAEIADHIQAITLSTWVAETEARDPRFRSRIPLPRDSMAANFRELDRALVDNAAANVLAAAVRRRPTTPSRQTTLVHREAEKKKRHLPVRELIADARDVIQAIHPVFMMSPLAVSQYLPADIQFDVVIFDEASQVPPGDAINCIYRAGAVIAAGDQKQLPPTSFFAAAQSSDDDLDADEDLANDYESLLDLMKSSGSFTSIGLRWHYRSRHEHLIAYSNNSFYEDRLVTFPGALADVPDAGVKFLKADGVYRRSQGQDNPKEAQFVADRVIHHLDTRPGRSVGVVAMSTAQRDAILNALVMKRAERPDLDEKFVESRLDGIFVKSLEEVQGDERDVIIMSVGYGPDETGTVFRNFGPINKKGGERRLNVAITRAKELTEVVSSMTAGQIGDVPSAGGRHLRRYLDYAERGPLALAIELGSAGLGTDSPFEDAVISAIRSWGYDVQPQVGVSGFRIDIGVKHPHAPGVFMLGVECDGAMYHSSRSARDRDRLRHEILEGLGWNLHHIWGTDWYRNRDREEERLRKLLEELEAQEFAGRLGRKPVRAASPMIEVEAQDFDVKARQAWIKDYVPLTGYKLRALDWTERSNARHLASFIQAMADAEGPVHINQIKARLRDHAGMDRINKHAIRTIMDAIETAAVTLDGDFVQRPRTKVTEVRLAGPRSLAEIADAEFRLAVLQVLESQVGANREELALSVSRAFGWLRTSPDLTTRVAHVVAENLSNGTITETGGVLRLTAGD